MLHPNDFRSIWELAHLWAGVHPESTESAKLPDDVIDRLQKLIWAFLRKKIGLRRKSGNRVIQDDMWLFIFNVNRTRVRLGNIVTTHEFDKEFLSSLFVMRGEILKWCDGEFLTPPAIWAPESVGAVGGTAENRSVGGRHKDDELNKQLCQAIARTLWDFDSQVHPAHMAKHKAILRYGNGALYKDEETVCNWIAEVDPLKKERKTGRPPAVPYLIDLEKGGFNKETVGPISDRDVS